MELGGPQSQLVGLGASLEGLGASLEGLGASSEGLGTSREGLGTSQEGLRASEHRKKNEKNNVFSVYGDTIGHCPLWGRCPKQVTIELTIQWTGTLS